MDNDNRKIKSISDSVTECMHIVKHEDINGGSRLFGGKLMQWMDETAGICAMRHSGSLITTAAVDDLQFKKGAGVGELIVLQAKITYVGRTSMEVRVDVYSEDIKTGMRHVINRAYFTEVCIDENGTPIEVGFTVRPESITEKAEWDGAIKRIQIRKKRRSEGY